MRYALSKDMSLEKEANIVGIGHLFNQPMHPTTCSLPRFQEGVLSVDAES